MQRVTSVITTGVVGLAAGAGVLVVFPGIALAVDGCENNRVCIFDDNDYKNRLGIKPAGEPRANVASQNNDRTDSWINDTTTNAAWYYNFTYENSDNCRTMYDQSSDGDLGVFNSDELSSWRTNRGC